MTIAESLLSELEAEMKSTRKLLERVPEAKGGWKPHEKSRSLGEIGRIARQSFLLAELGGGGRAVGAGSGAGRAEPFGQARFRRVAREVLEALDDFVALQLLELFRNRQQRVA